MGQHESASSESMDRPHRRDAFERDLERLQILVDFATGLLRTSLTAMIRVAGEGLAGEAGRLQFQDHANRAIASLHLHDVAAQMIADLRGHTELATAGVPSVSDAMARAHSRLLAEALSDADTVAGSGRDSASDPEDGAS